MTNDRGAQLFIFIALDCEAKSLVSYYGLKKENVTHPFSIYTNNNCVLTVTGVGKVAMAGAVAYTLAIFSGNHYPVLLNIGIAGHKTQAIGDLLMAEKIIDTDSGKKFYPQLIGRKWPETSLIKTVSVPCEQYSPACLYDMEAAAFYETAVKFSSSELIHCFKVVSDNEQSSIDKIQPKVVTEWIANQMLELDRLIKQIVTLSESITPVELKELSEIITKWHFTVTGKIRLKTLLMRWNVLSATRWSNRNENDFSTGKELLSRLEQDINDLEVHL